VHVDVVSFDDNSNICVNWEVDVTSHRSEFASSDKLCQNQAKPPVGGLAAAMIIRGELSRVESSMKMTGTATDLLHLLQRSLIRNIKHWGYSTSALCDELQSGELLPEALSFRS
jgi:hypothetical protein